MADHEPFAGMSQEETQIDVAETLREVCMRLSDIADSVGNLSPDITGRLRVNAEIVANIATITTVSTVSTVSTVGNQTNMGGLSAAMLVPNFSQMAEVALRQNVVF